jgi:hypothetical protein
MATRHRACFDERRDMRTALPKQAPATRSHRPRAVTVFAAAFVAGAAAAVGVNRALDVRLAQSKPRVESESIFVALRSLPQGAAVTVWDVALRDWPKAMMPATALRAHDTFSGRLLKHPLREGQPLLSIQLLPSGQASQPAAEATPSTPPADYTRGTTPVVPVADADLWAPAEPITPAEPIKVAVLPPTQTTGAAIQASPQPAVPAPAGAQAHLAPEAPAEPVASEPVASEPVASEPVAAEPVAAEPVAAEPVAAEPVVAEPVAAEPVAAEPVATEITSADAPADPVSTEPVSTSPSEEAVATAPSDVASDTTAAAVADDTAPLPEREPAPTAESNVAVEVAAAPIAAEPTAPATPPPAATRPAHGRYLVVPESIALKADTSFVKRVDAQPVETEPATRNNTRAAAETVRPLPPTAAAVGGPQSASRQPHAASGRSPQRQGRQSPSTNAPGNNGRPTGGQPERQSRFGTMMFPNLSGGMTAIEGRLRRDQPEQGQSPAAAGPVTAR